MPGEAQGRVSGHRNTAAFDGLQLRDEGAVVGCHHEMRGQFAELNEAAEAQYLAALTNLRQPGTEDSTFCPRKSSAGYISKATSPSKRSAST